MKDNYQDKTSNILLDYLNSLKGGFIIDEFAINETNEFLPFLFDKIKTPEETRFYLVMSTIFTDDTRYKTFVESLMTELVKKNTFMEQAIRNECERLKTLFIEEFNVEKKIFDDFEKSDVYQTYKNYKIDPFPTKLAYSTQKDANYKDNEKLLKQTYSDNNLDKLNNFNNKITFN